MAIARRIRHPHQEWARACEDVRRVRHKFAHMLYLNETEGDRPNRTLYFTRLGEANELRHGRGHDLGLKWRDEEWTQQGRHRDSVTEQEVSDTLTKAKWSPSEPGHRVAHSGLTTHRHPFLARPLPLPNPRGSDQLPTTSRG